MRRVALASILVLAGCSEPNEIPTDVALLCQGEQTAIADIQGKGFASPLTGSTRTVRGIVTRVERSAGFYVEEPGGSLGVSRAIFIADKPLSQTIQIGQDLIIRGQVAELGSGPDTLTALVATQASGVCAENADLPLTRIGLPLDSRQREALEGMRIAMDKPLSLTDHYAMQRGEWTLSTGAPLRLPTEDAAPGGKAAALAQRNRESSIGVRLPGPDFPALPVGATIENVVGVLGQQGNEQRLLLESTPSAQMPAVETIDPPPSGHLRIVSLNLLNFFNGDGRGGGFPTVRGAQNPTDFQLQRDRTAAAIDRIQPHLLAVQELENDGFNEFSAARSLLELLNSTAAKDWAFIEPTADRIGNDVITVGLFYRQQVLEPVGPAKLLHGPAFDGRSRVPLAQLFLERGSGEQFLVVVNHLKSKGRCPGEGPDADQRDGQGCWNSARVAAVSALHPWLSELTRKAGTRQLLILGDMNAWRQEDPIRAYRDEGYIELVEELAGLPQYSFLYFGQRGTLDYAFASPALARRARQAIIWHINADWPSVAVLPRPWLRMSDHDPVVVDFDFSQSATSD